jgi:hypothetical protein
MGVLWEMHQQGQGRRQAMRAEQANQSQDQQIASLRQQVEELEDLLGKVIHRIEVKLGEDLDDDGRVG